MVRITITIEDDLLAEIDAAAEARDSRTAPRSSAICPRRAAAGRRGRRTIGPMRCGAGLRLRRRGAGTSKRPVQNFDGDHDLSLATLHVDLDDEFPHGGHGAERRSGEVRTCDHIIAERGVRYGRVVKTRTHRQEAEGAKQGHRHARIVASPDGAEPESGDEAGLSVGTADHRHQLAIFSR